MTRVFKPDSGQVLEIQDEGGSAALTVETAGNVTVDAGNLVIGSTGGGIDFSACTGNAGAEILDDYEEGEWTIVPSNSVTLQATHDTGSYTKIGRQVTVSAQTVVNDPQSPVADLIYSLPFTSATLTENSDYWQGSVSLYNNAMPAGALWAVCRVYPGQALINFRCSKAGAAAVFLKATSSGYVDFTCTYFV